MRQVGLTDVAHHSAAVPIALWLIPVVIILLSMAGAVAVMFAMDVLAAREDQRKLARRQATRANPQVPPQPRLATPVRHAASQALRLRSGVLQRRRQATR